MEQFNSYFDLLGHGTEEFQYSFNFSFHAPVLSRSIQKALNTNNNMRLSLIDYKIIFSDIKSYFFKKIIKNRNLLISITVLLMFESLSGCTALETNSNNNILPYSDYPHYSQNGGFDHPFGV